MPERFAEDEHRVDRTTELVRCPACDGRAVATRDRVVCEACGFARTAADGAWYGPVAASARGRCGACGFTYGGTVTRPAGAQPPDTVELRCPGCGATDWFRAEASGRGDGVPRDPWFGLPLWLRTACRGETLWARNESHLDFLEAYVGADLRERRPYFNHSLASRLPGWIKDAHARDDVLRAIAKLRATL